MADWPSWLSSTVGDAVDTSVEETKKSKTFGGFEREDEARAEPTSEDMRLDLPEGVLELSLLRLSYDRWVMVEPLPLDLSELPVRLVNTESNEGFTFSKLSFLRDVALVLCLTGRL